LSFRLPQGASGKSALQQIAIWAWLTAKHAQISHATFIAAAIAKPATP
jgi:hypothetical protein